MSVPTAGEARYVGSRVPRVEDARLLTGRGTFVDDITRPGMLHACFVRSPFPRARILGIDASEALDLPGVRAVFSAGDLNAEVAELWYSATGKGMGTPLPPLAEGEARFVGDPVALVVAENRYIAEDAAELVEVDYEPLTAVVDYLRAAASPETVMEEVPGNLIGEMPGGNADAVDDALAGAAHVVEHTISQQMYAAVPIECRGIVAEWEATTGELTIWAATQSPVEVRSVSARILGIPEHRIRVIMRDTGGGFGQKVIPMREELAIVLAARRLGGGSPAPLKWIEDRRENLLGAGQARHQHAVVRMGFDDQGTIVAASIDHTEDAGAYPQPYPLFTGMAVGVIFPGPYRIPATSFVHRSVMSNTQGRVAYRGPWQFESVTREVTLDVAARRMGMDPMELRRRNILVPDDLPYANGNGMPYSDVSPSQTFEQALEMLDYEAFRREQAEARALGRHIGVGACNYVEPTAPGYSYYASEGATIRIDPTGRVTVYVAGGASGNSLETTAVQLTADELGVPIEDVHTIQGDTAITPFGAGTGGSRSGPMIAGAVAAAAKVLREKIAAIAAKKLKVDSEDIELADGAAFVRGDPSTRVTLADLAEAAYHHPGQLPRGMPGGLEASERYHAPSPMPVWANATHLCTVEVDTTTGAVKILRYIVSEDCGPMINPNVVEGQIAGGTLQGIGGALLEEMVFDDDGNPLASTFMDYLLPTAAEAPDIEYGHVVTMGPGHGGYKGVGEGGAIGATPAVINAVADALAPNGSEVTRLPLKPETVLSLLDDLR